MKPDCFNIGHIEYGSEIYGPGKRTVVWFQGCNLGCKGCWNMQYQPASPATVMSRSELLGLIIAQGQAVTFLGGEPLQQIDNLLWLTEQLKEHHIHVMLYTGYELDEIEADPSKKRMCQMADVLIPGRYREELRDTNLKWRGSRNQPLIFADREEPGRDENQVEIIIEPDGTVTCLGYPSEGLVQYLRSLDMPIRTAN